MAIEGRHHPKIPTSNIDQDVVVELDNLVDITGEGGELKILGLTVGATAAEAKAVGARASGRASDASGSIFCSWLCLLQCKPDDDIEDSDAMNSNREGC